MSSVDDNITCYLCMDPFKAPLTCVPCGHNFCAGCYKDHSLTKCPKCDKSIKLTIEDKVIEDVVLKYSYQKDTIKAFRNEWVWNDVAAAIQ